MKTKAAAPFRIGEGGLIDRNCPLSFTFDGKVFAGYLGDTVASALLANGVSLVGRSFKYHRPRGIFTAGSEEPNALIELRTGNRREPNTRATVAELYSGLVARSQNRWPSLRFDVGALNGLLSPLISAGFYYKTFMWPSRFWEAVYEPLIRRAAGLGRAGIGGDPDAYDRCHRFCDVLVVGAGPAGLMAALTAGRAGADVVVCDEDSIAGGRLNAETYLVNHQPGQLWAREVVSELAKFPNVKMLARTTVFGRYDTNTFGAIERVSDHQPETRQLGCRQRYWKIVSRQAILATGAIERSIVFPGNDLPGVMLGGAVRTYLNRYGVSAGERVGIVTTSDDGWQTAFDLLEKSVSVPVLVDLRDDIPASKAEELAARGTEIVSGCVRLEASGNKAVARLSISMPGNPVKHIAVDALALSGGWTPNIALGTHLGERPIFSNGTQIITGDNEMSVTAIGAANASMSLARSLIEGVRAGAAAAGALGLDAPVLQEISNSGEPGTSFSLSPPQGHATKAFVDLQNDVTVDDVILAAREGFTVAEHVKRYTTLGMGTDQGKTIGLNGAAALSSAIKRTITEIGTTTYRPPFTPVSIGAFAGRHRGPDFRPTRVTPAYEWALENGAEFLNSGFWLRPQWFSKSHEKNWLETVNREVTAVRTKVGFCDVSTLGKLDIQGPDAAALLDRIYANTFSTLPVGKTRYGIMLREDGFVFDDGTSARLGAQHFLMSTTTANVQKVLQHIEHARQVLWPGLKAHLVNVTEQWAQYAVAGPRSRELLQDLLAGSIDLSNEAFPYLACKEFHWRGKTIRLFRVSFSGELAYEIAISADHGDYLVREIAEAGAGYGVTPYGTEALSVLRLEKGHLIASEINGRTTAGDLGMDKLLSTKKNFIGKTLSQRPGLLDPARWSLVGIRPVNPGERFSAGAYLQAVDTANGAEEGYVTSVGYSPTLESWIGLGFLRSGRERHGTRLHTFDPLRKDVTELSVCSPCFYDPSGERLRM